MKQVVTWLRGQNPKLNLQWLADQLGLSRNTIKKWKQVPPRWCLVVEQLTGGELDRYGLRPDVFGQRPAPAADQSEAA